MASNKTPAHARNTYVRYFSDEARSMMLKQKQWEIDAFARDRSLCPVMLTSIAQTVLRLGRIPDLQMYGLFNDDAQAVAHFLADAILNVESVGHDDNLRETQGEDQSQSAGMAVISAWPTTRRGPKPKVNGKEARAVVQAWLKWVDPRTGLNYSPDYRSQRTQYSRTEEVWIRSDGKHRVVFKRTNLVFEKGQRGDWKRDRRYMKWGESLSTIDFATRLYKGAKKKVAESTENAHHLTESKSASLRVDVRRSQQNPDAVKLQISGKAGRIAVEGETSIVNLGFEKLTRKLVDDLADQVRRADGKRAEIPFGAKTKIREAIENELKKLGLSENKDNKQPSVQDIVNEFNRMVFNGQDRVPQRMLDKDSLPVGQAGPSPSRLKTPTGARLNVDMETLDGKPFRLF